MSKTDTRQDRPKTNRPAEQHPQDTNKIPYEGHAKIVLGDTRFRPLPLPNTRDLVLSLRECYTEKRAK